MSAPDHVTTELRFGSLLACYQPIRFDFGVIEPLHDKATAEAKASQGFNADGHIYPPMMASYRGWPGEPPKPEDLVPGSERPASAFRVPATHKMTWSGPAFDKYRHLPSIAIQLLGNWHGVTLQFEDWWSFRRMRWKVSKIFLGPGPDQQEAFAVAVRNAATFSADNQKRLLSLLSLLNAVETFEMEWESFAWAYTCIDAAWKILTDLGTIDGSGRRIVPHAERIKVLCTSLGIPLDESTIERAVRLRNDLLHEARWDGSLPGEGSQSTEAFLTSYELQRLATRLVFFILGVDCEFRTTHWNHASDFGGVHSLGLRRPA